VTDARGDSRATPSPTPGPGGAAAAARPSTARVWWLAIRPHTLPAAIAPVVAGLGAAAAGGTIAWGPAVGCLAVALLLQVAANLANDLADFRSGADAADRVGPLRVAAGGLVTPRRLAIATAIVVALAGLVGLYLVSVGGVVILVVGALAIVAALLYTGGPWPYGYHGLGEVFVFAFFGLVAVCGTVYLQSGTVDGLAILVAVAMGSLATAILVVNNLRDVESDRRAGKRTLAVILGPRFARLEYAALLVVAAAMPPVAWAGGLSGPTALLALIAAPLAIPLLRTVFADGDPRRLNAVLKGTARLELAVAVLLAVGLAVGGR
jgi:1,4-dihydroxy-2-naphthoate octaprenyltransferase